MYTIHSFWQENHQIYGQIRSWPTLYTCTRHPLSLAQGKHLASKLQSEEHSSLPILPSSEHKPLPSPALCGPRFDELALPLQSSTPNSVRLAPPQELISSPSQAHRQQTFAASPLASLQPRKNVQNAQDEQQAPTAAAGGGGGGGFG